jgi:hypothetical protein
MAPNLHHVEERLARLLSRALGLLPEEELRQMRELVSVGEPGVALENFCMELVEYTCRYPRKWPTKWWPSPVRWACASLRT